MSKGNRNLAAKRVKAIQLARYGGTPKATWSLDTFKGKAYDDLIHRVAQDRRVVRQAPTAFVPTYTLIRNGQVI